MPQPDRPDVVIPKFSTPIGGIVLSLVASGVLWGGMVVGLHVAGVF